MCSFWLHTGAIFLLFIIFYKTKKKKNWIFIYLCRIREFWVTEWGRNVNQSAKNERKKNGTVELLYIACKYSFKKWEERWEQKLQVKRKEKIGILSYIILEKRERGNEAFVVSRMWIGDEGFASLTWKWNEFPDEWKIRHNYNWIYIFFQFNQGIWGMAGFFLYVCTCVSWERKKMKNSQTSVKYWQKSGRIKQKLLRLDSIFCRDFCWIRFFLSI